MQHSLSASPFSVTSCGRLFQRKPLQLRLQTARRQIVRAHSTTAEPGQAGSSTFAGCQHLHKSRPATKRCRQTIVQAERAGVPPSQNTKVPSPFWRAVAAFFYLVPALDIMTFAEPLVKLYPLCIFLIDWIINIVELYHSSQFTPLIIFFLIYLSIVKNTKLLHFVRFHAMQSVMVDIAAMVYSVIKSNLPMWWTSGAFSDHVELYVYTATMFTIFYCVGGALLGVYTEVTFISDSVYVQVDQSAMG